ncbi:GNAT family N-acetyltransferase [Candidatus Woesearchaeota archaeon]|nr:GNAT family N-acetyltransferase [Candidatus Woesearchaeota archaeon]
MIELLIRNVRENDRGEINSLYDYCFREGYDTKELEEVRKELDTQRIIVAEFDSRVVGFGSYIPLARSSSLYRDVENVLWHARSKGKDFLENYFRKQQQRIGKGNVVVEFYDTLFTQQEIKVEENDFYLACLAINPQFRRRGIGEIITRTRIRRAQEEGAGRIYVDCYGNSRVSELYIKLGFQPIINVGPVYNDGASLCSMGLLLG